MGPLSRRTRTKLFMLSVVVFIVGVPLLIGYGTGYRFDTWSTLAKTGGIFIHSDVGNTHVYLDGVLVERSGALLKNTLIQNLASYEQYEVLVLRDGYHDWRKVLPVSAHVVTEAHTLMLPKDIPWERLEQVATGSSRNATNSIEITTERAMAEEVGTTTTQEDVVLLDVATYTDLTERFAERERGEFSEVVGATATNTPDGAAGTTTLYGYVFPEDVRDALAAHGTTTAQSMFRERSGMVFWLEAGNVHALWVNPEETRPFYLCTPRMTEDEHGGVVGGVVCEDVLVLDWEDDILRYNTYPGRDDVLVVQVLSGLYAVELDNRSERNIQPIYEGAIADFRVIEEDIVVRTLDGVFFRADMR